MDNNKTSSGVFIAWAAIIIAYIIGYTNGTGSKQPYIDTLNQQVSVLQSNIKVFKSGCEVTLCNDGSCSFSVGSGTCSHHDGVEAYAP